MNIDGQPNQILIASITPYFLEKEIFWFEQNLQNILKSQKSQSFFQDNVVFLEIGKSYELTALLRKLDEMGYEKVFKIQNPGELSRLGGIIEVFPINTLQAFRLDFWGNKLDSIIPLDIKIKNEKKSREILQKRLKSQKIFSDLKNLRFGDYLVHLDHGVGKFSGTQKIKEQEYYILDYAKQDKLFVPFGLERKLSRYIGFCDPVISRLGSTVWQKTKKTIKENVEKLAKELLTLYASKETSRRPPYQIEEQMEAEIKNGFFFEETPDQTKVMEDIRQDLTKDTPMDRIVCGDVGFGKTEIAIRTALIACASGRQTVMICPTTILANQHFQNFQKRFEKLPVRLAHLSRLQTKKDQEKIIKEIASGKIDIVIGTHRLLSSDIIFKNLQLLIIDDEQRFGVKQKEKLRQKNPSLDLLSLSATPIPRTMYLALSSFKNISLMQTPPRGRESIVTITAPYSKSAIKKAILQEINRNGQIYFLHNRIETIEKTVVQLKKLLPRASFAIIHGRLPEKKLLKIMMDFISGKYQILVATTIIENGIDLPNVNTIIIEDASRLGLAQTHQIRGRVGRGFIKGFAYLFYPRHTTQLVRERLQILSQATELGAGYQIALKDLELRGAGNILGKEQSGSINKIGLNLYCQMLAEAVEKLRN